MPAYFITSTGTDIGKTFATAGLLRHWRAMGKPARAIKPLLSGFSMADAAASDAGRILAAMGGTVTAESLSAITPWRFAAPLSPDMAAAREGKRVDVEAVTEFCRDFAAGDGIRLIEGVGGVMVPLDARRTVLDWMDALRLPAVLVAGTYLGTISHILTAAAALTRRHLPLAAVVLNHSGDDDVPVADTVAALTRFLPNTPLIALPRERDGRTADFSALAAVLE